MNVFDSYIQPLMAESIYPRYYIAFILISSVMEQPLADATDP